MRALRECLVVIEKRETRYRVQWYYKLYEETQGGLLAKGASVDERRRLNDLHYYTPATRRWTTPYALGHWPSHRSGHSTTLVSGGPEGPRLVVLGGIDGDGAYTADLDVYDLAA